MTVSKGWVLGHGAARRSRHLSGNADLAGRQMARVHWNGRPRDEDQNTANTGWLYLTASIAGQTPLRHRVAELLPGDARIIETANVTIPSAKTRVLVLSIIAPRRVICAWDYAGDFLYGNHSFGPTFLSLIDPSTGRLINTVAIRPHQESPNGQGGLAIPFLHMTAPTTCRIPTEIAKGNLC